MHALKIFIAKNRQVVKKIAHGDGWLFQLLYLPTKLFINFAFTFLLYIRLL